MKPARPARHGWLYSVDLGATTIWERWNSVGPDGTISDTGMNSLNHYAYGSVMEFVYGYAAGIRPLEAGFSRAIIAPHPDIRLPEVDCAYDSVSGLYTCRTQIRADGSLYVRIGIPFGCEAQVYLPEYPAEAPADGGISADSTVPADGGISAFAAGGLTAEAPADGDLFADSTVPAEGNLSSEGTLPKGSAVSASAADGLTAEPASSASAGAPVMMLQAGTYEFIYQSVHDFRRPYGSHTSLGRIAQDEAALEILTAHAPAIAGMASGGDPEMCAHTLEDISHMTYLPFSPDALEEAIRALPELTVDML